MHRTLLYFIISTFLSAAFSSNAAHAECAAASDSTAWLMRAVACERVVFTSGDAAEANDALVEKASCYAHAGRFKEAAATLDRVSMYLLEPVKQEEVLLRKEICAYLCGDFEAAASIALLRQHEDSTAPLESLCRQMRELHMAMPGPKKETTATVLAFLPPLGQFYTHNWAKGLKSFLLNGSGAAWTAYHCITGDWITGLLGGGIALSHTYMANQDQSLELVREYNDAVIEAIRVQMEEIFKKNENCF